MVCQAWYNPAMDALWSERMYLQDLLNVLSPLEKRGRKFFFTGPLTPYSWSRFHSLARRVRDASLFNHPLDATLVSELSRTNPNSGPLLPNVRRLWLREVRIEYSLIWMSPAIEGLNLFLETKGDTVGGERHDPVTVSDFFTRMGELCPNLLDISLGGQGIGPGSIDVATRAIGQLNSLQIVHVSSNDQSDVTAILLKMAELPEVRELWLDCIVTFPSEWLPSTVAPFPELQKLLIKWPSTPGTIAFLHNLAAAGSQLRELELGEDLDGEIESMAAMIRLAGEHRQLESLTMYGRVDDEPLTIEVIAPILRCASLITLSLDTRGELAINDGDFETIASNLPKLKHFMVTTHSDETPTLSLQALSVAITFWPYLEHLSLEVDARDPVPENDHMGVHKCLQELHLGASPISTDPIAAAWFIAGLSGAEEFKVSYDGHSPRSGLQWARLVKMLPGLQASRAGGMSKVAITSSAESG
ncbi:hypothetical protein FRB94_006555 [Tulasnella sp. JGI-2019a]|nr:hypothetical protein FRB94_006555 [Tulasnella sp. JGI-2019a]